MSQAAQLAKKCEKTAAYYAENAEQLNNKQKLLRKGNERRNLWAIFHYNIKIKKYKERSK